MIKKRLRDEDDELEIVIVKDMMLTGYDSPPLHTLYLDRPLKGALLMQTLARVNRTFRGKEDGLLVAYAPLADNLQKVLSEYTQQDRKSKPLGRDAEEAVALTETLMATLGELLSGFDWKAVLRGGGKRAFLPAVDKTVEYVRAPATPGNQVPDGEETLAARYRKLSGQLARAWRSPEVTSTWRSCGRRRSSTKRSASGWRSMTQRSGRPAVSRCLMTSSGC